MDRQEGDNTRCTIYLLELINRQKLPSLLLSLDVESMWTFFHSHTQSVQLPYTYLKRPGTTQKFLIISNSTRHGCPLSPLLYALSEEPLEATIRDNPDITRITLHSMQFKSALFANDVLLTLSKPMVSLPNLHNLLDQYSSISGYKLHITIGYSQEFKI